MISNDNKKQSQRMEDAMMAPSPSDTEQDNKNRPPIGVIVVASATARQDAPARPSSSRRASPGSSLFSAPFRLQPRGSMTIATQGRDGSIRGRKRSAQSMTTSKLGPDPSPLLTTKQPAKPLPTFDWGSTKPSAVGTTTPKKQFGFTPPRDTRRGAAGRVDNTMVNFQCLSLQSPKRADSCASPSMHCPSPPQTLPLLPDQSGLPPSSSSAGTICYHLLKNHPEPLEIITAYK